MNALRRIAKNKNGRITIDLPSYFTSKEVEVIVIPINEQPPAIEKPKRKVDLTKYYGILKTGLTRKQLDAEIKKLRAEWDRGF